MNIKIKLYICKVVKSIEPKAHNQSTNTLSITPQPKPNTPSVRPQDFPIEAINQPMMLDFMMLKGMTIWER